MMSPGGVLGRPILWLGSTQMPAGNCNGVSPVSTRGWRMTRYSGVDPGGGSGGGEATPVIPGIHVDGGGMKLRAAKLPAGEKLDCTVIVGGTVVLLMAVIFMSFRFPGQ